MNGGTNWTQQWQQIKANVIKCKRNKFLVPQRFCEHWRQFRSLVYANFSFFKWKFNFTLNELSLNFARKALGKNSQSEMLAWWWELFAPFCGGEYDSVLWKTFSFSLTFSVFPLLFVPKMKNMFWLLNFFSRLDLILSSVDWKTA